MIRAALYARISTAEQRPDLQVTELHQVAAQRGWSIVFEGVDVASGTRASRPQLDALRSLVRKGQVDVVAVWRLDRLARSLRNFLDTTEELRSNNVALVSLREGIDLTTAVGRTFAQLIAVIAEMERELIRERVVAGVAEARRRGKQIGRRRRRVDLDQARALRASGLSIREVAASMCLPRSVVHRALVASETK
jgi:DNA invertase Pin-like site-specific DNA recombinase